MEQGRDGYFVEPEDRKMLLDLFDRGGFTDGYYAKSTMDGACGCAEGNRNSGRETRNSLNIWIRPMWWPNWKEKGGGMWSWRRGEPSRLTLEGEKVQGSGQAPQAAPNISP